MSELRIRNDIAFLAGSLEHRLSNSQKEHEAAAYIHDRFEEYTPDVELDAFHCQDDPWLLFGSYYAEFAVVSLIATWFPRVALCYGAAVFLAYLAEFGGHAVLGRLLPRYDTQNVAARFLAPKPRRLFVITAHYDSGKTCPLMQWRAAQWLRFVHPLLAACMILVLAATAVRALGVFDQAAVRPDTLVRWLAAACLLAAAAVVFACDAASEPVRGANDNASGSAVLLALAERFAEESFTTADVCLLATGSHYGWMNGIGRYLATHHPDRATTYFLNIDEVGLGELAYTTGEGVLHESPSAKEMVEAARSLATEYGAAPTRLCKACSDALIPSGRGYKAMTITAVEPGEGGQPPDAEHDCYTNLDFDLIAKSAGYAEAILRRLDA